MVTQSSRAGKGGIVTGADWPRILSPWTEPVGGRLPSAMKTEKVVTHMALTFMIISTRLKWRGTCMHRGGIISLCGVRNYLSCAAVLTCAINLLVVAYLTNEILGNANEIHTT